MKKEDVYIIMIDLFCGGGGTSEAAKMSGSVKVIAAVNHDPLAIKSHRANHKNVVHFDEDILLGPKNKQKKHIGNSVETTVVSKWFEAIEKQARA